MTNAMTVDDWQRIFHRELMTLFKEECRRRDVSLKDLSRQAGYNEDYFYLLRSGRRRLTLDLLLKICEHLGRSPADLFRRFAVAGANQAGHRVEQHPADLLGGLRELGEQRSDPFLARAIGEIAFLREREIARQAEVLSLRSLVVQLEESRLSAPDYAKKRLEQLARRLFAALRRGAGVDARLVGDLAVTMAAWAALRRLVGARNDANDALCAAFDLADRTGDAWVEAFCHQKAAYLLQDLGQHELGLAFTEKATLLYNEAGSSLDLARCLVDRGYMLGNGERLEESNRAFEAALRHLPSSEATYICFAHHNLAVNARKAGNLAMAARSLQKAVDTCGRRDPRQPLLRREQGLLEIQLGHFEAAAQHLHSALRSYGRAGQLNQAAAVALDFAEVLVRSDRVHEAESLAREVASWFPAKVTNRLQQELLEDFFAIIRLGQLNLPNIERVRGRLDGLEHGNPDQPPGGK